MLKISRTYLKRKNTIQQNFFSQEGEDLLLSRIFDKKEDTGFYVDIGAHHPKRFSNTFYFYLKGWSGINIDPLPGMKGKFDKVRPNDINIEMGVSLKKEKIPYFMFKEPAFNTFSQSVANKHKNKSLLCQKKEISTDRLDAILSLHLPKNQTIDFLSIDVEGFEFDVIQSNNWEHYQPKVIVLELFDFNFYSINENDIINYLVEKGYKLFAKLFHSVFFILTKDLYLVERN